MLVLRAGQVFDGERSRGAAGVLIQDGKIIDLDTSWAQPPEGAQVLDFGPDACLLPGLIDAHVHLAFDASADVVTSLAACDDNALSDRMEAAAVRALRAGVTTVRDLGDRNYLSLKLSKRFRQPRSRTSSRLARLSRPSAGTAISWGVRLRARPLCGQRCVSAPNWAATLSRSW
jgi:imidazolonepropionase-like amidohydrolase